MADSPLASVDTGLVQVTATSLCVVPGEHLSLDETGQLLDQVWELREASGWWEIDLFVWAKKKYPETYTQIVDQARYGMGTVLNRIRLGENMPAHSRVEGISIAHHMEVAPTHISIEKKIEWLKLAKAEGWTRDELRYHLTALPSGEQEEVIGPRPISYQSAIYLVLDWLDGKVEYSREDLGKILRKFMDERKEKDGEQR